MGRSIESDNYVGGGIGTTVGGCVDAGASVLCVPSHHGGVALWWHWQIHLRPASVTSQTIGLQPVSNRACDPSQYGKFCDQPHAQYALRPGVSSTGIGFAPCLGSAIRCLLPARVFAAMRHRGSSAPGWRQVADYS